METDLYKLLKTQVMVLPDIWLKFIERITTIDMWCIILAITPNTKTEYNCRLSDIFNYGSDSRYAFMRALKWSDQCLKKNVDILFFNYFYQK